MSCIREGKTINKPIQSPPCNNLSLLQCSYNCPTSLYCTESTSKRNGIAIHTRRKVRNCTVCAVTYHLPLAVQSKDMTQAAK